MNHIRFACAASLMFTVLSCTSKPSEEESYKAYDMFIAKLNVSTYGGCPLEIKSLRISGGSEIRGDGVFTNRNQVVSYGQRYAAEVVFTKSCWRSSCGLLGTFYGANRLTPGFNCDYATINKGEQRTDRGSIVFDRAYDDSWVTPKVKSDFGHPDGARPK
jgi:hypothetical protein